MSPREHRTAPKPVHAPAPSAATGNRARQIVAIVLVIVGLLTLLVPGFGLVWWLGAIWLVGGIVLGWNEIAAVLSRR